MQTILIVEDELPIAEMLSDILEETNYKVVLASNGRDALARLEKTRPDMILSDVMMPVMDGRALCKRLQGDPKLKSIPVVLMSAAYNSINLAGCEHVAFLKKPFAIDDLIDTVDKVLGGGSKDGR